MNTAAANARVDRIEAWNDGVGAEWREHLPGLLQGVARIGIEPDHMPPPVRSFIESLVDPGHFCDVSEVIAEMRKADLFVLPSRIAEDGDRDGLPNVLMEAASQRLPILSTPVSAIPEFIETGVHGILSDDDPAALAQAITTLANNPGAAERMAKAAYDRLIAEFRMDPGIARLSKRLNALCMEEA